MSNDYIPGSSARTRVAEPVHDEPVMQNTSAPAATLMIATPTPAKPQFGTLSWLAHVMGLDTYGSATLSYAARVDMNTASLILAAIFLFDLSAWCLLFYFIVNSGSIGFSPGRMIFALGGVLPALALFLYERSFMTADTKSRGWGRLILPTAIRLCVIAGAAWITAQPVEMLTFGQRIKGRVQEELIRKNVVGYYRELKEVQALQGGVAGAGSEIAEMRAKELEKERQRAQQSGEQYNETKSRLDSLVRKETDAKNELNQVLQSERARIAGTQSKEDPKTSPAVKDAAARLNALQQQAAQLSGRLHQLDGIKQSAEAERDRVDRQLTEAIAQKKADVTKEGLDNWVRILKVLPPGQDKTSFEGGKLYEFKFTDYDFLDKFRIIDDVLSGRPPRWPGADQTMTADLKQQYGMYDLDDIELNSRPRGESASGENAKTVVVDPVAKERRQAEVRNAKRMYWAIFGVAVIIPLLSLLFKLIMPAHLAYYYSSEWQAQQGNPWAIAMEAAIGSMEDQRAGRRIAGVQGSRSGRPRGDHNPPSWGKGR